MQPNSKDDESNLDNTPAYSIQCIHDIRLVWPLKLQEMKISTSWPLILVILFSWGVAFLEYCAQVPANRIGFDGNGGPFNLMQLKVIQEVISLTVFTVIVTVMFKGQGLQWNHFAAFFCLIMAVFFVFLK